MLPCIVAPMHQQHGIITSSNKCLIINSLKLPNLLFLTQQLSCGISEVMIKN
jgi:hypothetical protein